MLLPPSEHRQCFKTNTDLLSVRFLMNGPAGQPLLDLNHPTFLPMKNSALPEKIQNLILGIESMFGPARTNLDQATGNIRDHLRAECLFADFLDELLGVFDQMGFGLRRLKQQVTPTLGHPDISSGT